jgi:hypothetical protein
MGEELDAILKRLDAIEERILKAIESAVPGVAWGEHRGVSPRAGGEGEGTRSPSFPSSSTSQWTSEDVHAIWPALVEAAAAYGVQWRAHPGESQKRIVLARLRGGAVAEELVMAIHGWVKRQVSGEEDHAHLHAHLRAQTVYRPETFDSNVEAGWPEERPVAVKDIKQQETLQFLNDFGKEQLGGD